MATVGGPLGSSLIWWPWIVPRQNATLQAKLHRYDICLKSRAHPATTWNVHLYAPNSTAALLLLGDPQTKNVGSWRLDSNMIKHNYYHIWRWTYQICRQFESAILTLGIVCGLTVLGDRVRFACHGQSAKTLTQHFWEIPMDLWIPTLKVGLSQSLWNPDGLLCELAVLGDRMRPFAILSFDCCLIQQFSVTCQDLNATSEQSWPVHSNHGKAHWKLDNTVKWRGSKTVTWWSGDAIRLARPRRSAHGGDQGGKVQAGHLPGWRGGGGACPTSRTCVLVKSWQLRAVATPVVFREIWRVVWHSRNVVTGQRRTTGGCPTRNALWYDWYRVVMTQPTYPYWLDLQAR